VTDDTNILALVPGEYISKAGITLPYCATASTLIVTPRASISWTAWSITREQAAR
jgi:hypothetical protein